MKNPELRISGNCDAKLMIAKIILIEDARTDIIWCDTPPDGSGFSLNLIAV